MRLKYDGKKSEKDILSESISVNIEKSNDILSKNKLFIGDNYYTMKYMLNELNMQSTIDLVYYADEKRKIGKKLQDIWNYKDPQYPEYPTQKNKKLIDLIISTSSNENDLIMDCFAGSGTTIFSASRLNRNWIGIEKSEEAIKIIINRLSKTKRLSLFHPYSIIYEMYMCH